jgi:hypothetical protein
MRDFAHRPDDFHRAWPVLARLQAPGGDTDSVAMERPPRPLSIEGIRLVVNGHGQQIGLDSLRPHDLRRTLAGTLDASGVPLQDIRVVLRHETLTATQSYLADNPLRAHTNNYVPSASNCERDSSDCPRASSGRSVASVVVAFGAVEPAGLHAAPFERCLLEQTGLS